MSVALEVAGASSKHERRNRRGREMPAADRPASMTRRQHRLAQRLNQHLFNCDRFAATPG
jgi:hypothetical protein